MVKLKNVMNIKDVAEYLSIHTSTVYRYAKDGNIPAFKIGSDWRFSRKHIDKWIDERMSGNGNGGNGHKK